ncbi:MAG: LytR/AlgR family response regulator transcription factor [Prevotella sp.]|jgi:DNA-binding LytR/AlgR family response regulator
MKRILIIEDELISAQRIARLIADYDETIEIEGPLKTVDEVVRFMSEGSSYDLIISDIKLSGHTVFEAFEQCEPKSFVIFTTAYDEFAMKAIKSNGIDYLLKPIKAEELKKALDKVKKLSNQAMSRSSLANFAKDMNIWRTRLLVSRADELISLNVKEISCIYKDNRQTKVFTPSGETYNLTESVSELEQTLNPSMFFRINRQYIANINFLERISYFFSSKLHVRIKGCDDNNILISKDRAAKFKQWLNR